LIDLANARGGPDNITVVTARFEGEGLPEAAGGEGVGYRSYHVPVPPAGSAASEPDEVSGSESGSAVSLDRLRNLGLIVLLLGVLMLLLAVWR
jgi:hypothetical protein